MNNFFREPMSGVNANQHLEELEQVAEVNEYSGEYSYEYGDYGQDADD